MLDSIYNYWLPLHSWFHLMPLAPIALPLTTISALWWSIFHIGLIALCHDPHQWAPHFHYLEQYWVKTSYDTRHQPAVHLSYLKERHKKWRLLSMSNERTMNSYHHLLPHLTDLINSPNLTLGIKKRKKNHCIFSIKTRANLRGWNWHDWIAKWQFH